MPLKNNVSDSSTALNPQIVSLISNLSCPPMNSELLRLTIQSLLTPSILPANFYETKMSQHSIIKALAGNGPCKFSQLSETKPANTSDKITLCNTSKGHETD